MPLSWSCYFTNVGHKHFRDGGAEVRAENVKVVGGGTGGTGGRLRPRFTVRGSGVRRAWCRRSPGAASKGWCPQSGAVQSLREGSLESWGGVDSMPSAVGLRPQAVTESKTRESEWARLAPDGLQSLGGSRGLEGHGQRARLEWAAEAPWG